MSRAGTVVHLPRASVPAHRDLHFRLLRHNLVADIRTSIQSFMESGGLKALKKKAISLSLEETSEVRCRIVEGKGSWKEKSLEK